MAWWSWALASNAILANFPQFDAAGVPRFVTNPVVFVDGDGDGRFTAAPAARFSPTLKLP